MLNDHWPVNTTPRDCGVWGGRVHSSKEVREPVTRTDTDPTVDGHNLMRTKNPFGPSSTTDARSLSEIKWVKGLNVENVLLLQRIRQVS